MRVATQDVTAFVPRPSAPFHLSRRLLLKKYAKFFVAAVGVAVTYSLATFPPNSTAWQVASAVAAVLTALGVHQVPNKTA
jgi:hypothetical protein